MARVDLEKLASSGGLALDSNKITFVVPGADMMGDIIEYPNMFEITRENSFQHYDFIVKEGYKWKDKTIELSRLVFTEERHKNFEDEITDLSKRPYVGNGYKHIVGRIDLHLVLIEVHPHLPIVWKYPEAGIHPEAQGGIAEVMIVLFNEARERDEYTKSWEEESEVIQDSDGNWIKNK